MTNQVDRFGNHIDVGDVIAYAGTNIGLIVGVVVKLNPASYKVKYLKRNWKGDLVEQYANVMFDFNSLILTAKGMNAFNPLKVLNEVEQRRLGLIS